MDEMSKRKNLHLTLLIVLILLSIDAVYSSEQIAVEFLYYDPSTDPRFCDTCPPWIAVYEEFLMENQTINNIRLKYSEDPVVFEWIDILSPLGVQKKQSYNISILKTSVLVINGSITIVGDFNQTYIEEVVDSILAEIPPPNPPPEPSSPLTSILASAFLFGFLETFSPCLIILLSFILSYSLGVATRFKESFLQVMIFGVGFALAAIFIGVVAGIIFLSLIGFETALTWIVCIIAIFFGLSMLGVFKSSLETKPLVRKLARKYAFTYGGLALLGFLFYFLDPCIAPVFIAMLPILSAESLPLILLVFSIGVILPFLFIGVLAGSISKLARGMYRHKSKIRAISGLLLIIYALYFIFFYLL